MMISRSRNWIWPLVAGLALGGPTIVVAGLIPSATFLGLGLVFLACMLLASSMEFLTLRETEAAIAKVRSVAELIDELEVIDTLPVAPGTTMAVGVSRVGGKCVLDFHEGDRWKIAANGGLSRPLCEPAAAALCAAMAEAPEAAEIRFTCRCPIAESDVVDFVGRAEA